MHNAGFLMAEDAALKHRLLNGLYVSDDRNDRRNVQVFFRYPEGETERLYPFVTIELISINHARGRQESEVNYYYPSDNGASSLALVSAPLIDYFPSELDEDGLSTVLAEYSGSSDYLVTDQMLPIDLVYQVSTYCRSQRHDRELTSGILRGVFPFRNSFILIPEDGTSRRCDLLSWRSADILDQEAGYKKRIFRKVYTIQINSEIPQSNLDPVRKAIEVIGSLDNRDYPSTPEQW